MNEAALIALAKAEDELDALARGWVAAWEARNLAGYDAKERNAHRTMLKAAREYADALHRSTDGIP